MNKKWLIIIFIFIILAFGIFYFSFDLKPLSSKPKGDSFSVDSIFLKSAMKSKGVFDKQIKIQNNLSSINHFNLKFIDLNNLTFLESESFDLNSGEIKEINIVFSNQKNLNGGIYSGGISISDLYQTKTIPIILEIESDDVIFDSNSEMYPKGKIYSGDAINPEIKIFDLSRIGSANVELTYFIKSFEGETIVSDTENMVVPGQILITKSFNLPVKISPGNYMFGIIIKYKNSIGTSSAFFTIDSSPKDNFFFISGNNYFIFFSAIVVIIILFLVFIIYFVYSRDKFIKELTKDYRINLRRQEDYLEKKEKANEIKLKTKTEKEINKNLFRKLRKERKKAIKTIYHERIKRIRKLKKTGKKNQMTLQINQWKKKGYNVDVLESDLRVPTIKDIKKKVNQWKKKGYNVDVLGR